MPLSIPNLNTDWIRASSRNELVAALELIFEDVQAHADEDSISYDFLIESGGTAYIDFRIKFEFDGTHDVYQMESRIGNFRYTDYDAFSKRVLVALFRFIKDTDLEWL